MPEFEGFTREGLDLLGRLPGFDREAFQDRKAAYDRSIMSPAKAFVDALGARLRGDVSPHIRFAAKVNGSLSPIHNDRRFNPDAPAYKDHLLMRFWEGPDKKVAPTLYVRLTSTSVGFATGMTFRDVSRWREAVDAHGAALAAGLAELVEARDADVVGDDLKRVPKPYDADHPRGDLLRHKWLQARWPVTLTEAVHTPGFVDACAAELGRAAPVHRWLVQHLGATA